VELSGSGIAKKKTPWQKMLESLKVLGKDALGDWHDPTVPLSLGRAQFFNTPESRQKTPVIEAQGCVLVWDGRIDDREALIGNFFPNTTDGQLIIESYRRWGVDCLNHLIGEYTFILWDVKENLLFVGCDVVGGRTLSYYWDHQTLLLSSRLVSLLHHPQVNKDLDRLYLAHTINSSAAHPPGITPFRDLKRLRPGHALILKSGQLQEREVANLNIARFPRSPRNPEQEYEHFWYLLNSAVQDRLRCDRPVCTTLSGGLDSTTVTVSLLNYLPSVDAFSNVTTVFPEFDEREPIQSFLVKYPQIKWHGINGDRAWVLSESWDQLPIPDDPLIATTLAMDLQLMASMQHQGFGRVFDGDWGDDIFYTNLKSLLKAGSWQKAQNYLQSVKFIKSTLFGELILPYLPKDWQQKWFQRWQNRRSRFTRACRRDYFSFYRKFFITRGFITFVILRTRQVS
jgi:asparagine synthase (glutamine-hydrolysing)